MSSHREKIDLIIELEKTSSFVNHFLSNLVFSNKMIAQKRKNEYKIWRSDRWSSFMYSTFQIKFDQEGSITAISEELNVVGKYIKYAFFAFTCITLGLVFTKLLYSN